MKVLRLSIITFIAFLMQTTVVRYFAVDGIIPNIIVVFVICYSLVETNFTGAVVYGLLCGAALDFSAETIFGLHSLLCMLCAAMCVLAGERFFKGKFFVCILFVCIVSFIYEIAYYAMSFAMYQNASPLNALAGTAIPTMVYNTVLAVPVLLIMRSFSTAKNE